MEDALITALVLIVLIPAFIVAPVVTGLKGRGELVALGVLFHPIWWVGAFLLAKPTSWWARRFYTGEKLALSQRRYPPPMLHWQANRPAPGPPPS